MDFTFKKPLVLMNGALRAGWPLLFKLKKAGKKEKEAQIPGFGWHELKTNESAGYHASCYGLKLIANANFPMSDSSREQSAKEVVKLLKSTIEFPTAEASGKHRSHYLEAQNTTIKVANFLSACAAVGQNKNLKHVFKELRIVGRDAANQLLKHECDGKWEHWLVKPNESQLKTKTSIPKEIDTYYPTATVFEALHCFGKSDSETRHKTQTLLKRYACNTFREFLELYERHGENPPIKELWKRLPAIRTLAILGRHFFADAEPKYAATRTNFERIFNSYIRQELFTFELNHTDDFQKFDGKKPIGTDYVSFNTTACLADAVIGAVETKKISPLFCEWVAPYLCVLSTQITTGRLPRPKRFSYIHQAFNCLLAATKLENEARCFPKKIRMNIFPRVFWQHSFRKMTHRGFYVTPFEFKDASLNSEKLRDHFVTACKTFNRKIELVRADHTPAGVITEKIWRYLNESAFIIAVCVDANPNVYYEVGVAHTLGKPVLLIGRPDKRGEPRKESDFRFDIQNIHREALAEFSSKTIKPVVKRFLEYVYSGEL